jgi:predicted RNA binding protein YcfA (HicA-like mRNA interferase family)
VYGGPAKGAAIASDLHLIESWAGLEERLLGGVLDSTAIRRVAGDHRPIDEVQRLRGQRASDERPSTDWPFNPYLLAQPNGLAYTRSMVTVRDMLKRLAEGGWVIVRQTGSHRQLQHPTKADTITVAGHPSETIPVGTYKSILRRAGLRNIR